MALKQKVEQIVWITTFASVTTIVNAVPISENNFGNPAAWTAVVLGTGPSFDLQPHGFTARLPPTSAATTTAEFGVQFDSIFTVEGNFSIEVDYVLSSWPPGNGTRVGIGVARGYGTQRVSEVFSADLPNDDAYVFLSGSIAAVVPTTHLNGGIRLERDGSTLAGYFWEPASGWVKFGQGSIPVDGFHVSVGVWSDNRLFDNQMVTAEFKNLNISADVFGRGSHPPFSVPDGDNSWVSIAISSTFLTLASRISRSF